ncbi:MAG TPA: DUF6785 family protein [Planctomycetota bacterium]|nr:DUF6785 family protein [Planctomycetota bacterium]
MRRFRAILVGAALAAVINVWEPFGYYVSQGLWMRFGYISVAVLLPFLLLVFPVNVLLRAVRRDMAFQPWELVIIFSMGMVAAVFPSLGIIGFLLSYISAPFYYASPENFWAEWMSRTMPRWLAPSDTGRAVEWLFNGLPRGEPIPWQVWVTPLFWWSVLIAALLLCSFCTMVILRRQWVDNERLAFPLAELPMLLMEERSGSAWPAVAHRPLFWFGFGIPFFVICWNMIAYFEWGFPTIPFQTWASVQFSPKFPAILCKANFFVMGFAYFTPTNILFSVWFFRLVFILEAGFFNTVGLDIGPPDNWGCPFSAACGWQNWGGFLVLVLFGFWMARGHLAGVARRALGLKGGVDDSREVIRYRTAVVGLLLGGAVVFAWYVKAGMSFRVAAFFVPVGFLIYVGVTRLVAQTGLIYLWSPITPQAATFYTLGYDKMSSADRLMVGLGYCVNCNNERLIPYTAAHNLRMAAVEPKAHRGFLLMMALAAGVSMAVGVVYTLTLCYTRGAHNFDAFEWSRGHEWIFGYLAKKELNPMPTDWNRMLFMGIGAVTTGAVAVLQYRYAWWPVHPVGMAIGAGETTGYAAFSIFLTWIIKTLIIKLGGIQAYRRWRYFFVGIMVGYVAGLGMSFLVDCVWFPGDGHKIHVW